MSCLETVWLPGCRVIFFCYGLRGKYSTYITLSRYTIAFLSLGTDTTRAIDETKLPMHAMTLLTVLLSLYLLPNQVVSVEFFLYSKMINNLLFSDILGPSLIDF